jgi:hypothetical protein
MRLLNQPTDPSVVFRVDVEYENSKAVEVSSARIGFERTLARLGACPILRPIGPVDAMACGHVAVGMLFARSQGVPGATRDTGAWGSGGASLVLRFDLGARFSLELSGGIDAAFRRDRFFLQPDQDVQRVPAVSGLAGLGIFRSL